MTKKQEEKMNKLITLLEEYLFQYPHYSSHLCAECSKVRVARQKFGLE